MGTGKRLAQRPYGRAPGPLNRTLDESTPADKSAQHRLRWPQTRTTRPFYLVIRDLVAFVGFLRPAQKNYCIGGATVLSNSSPNYARACGRVLVGGHPDKRPDSRPGQDRDYWGGNPNGDDPGRNAAFRTLTSSRRENRRTLLSPGDAT